MFILNGSCERKGRPAARRRTSAICRRFAPVARVNVLRTFTKRTAIAANRTRAPVSMESVRRWIASAASFGEMVRSFLSYINAEMISLMCSHAKLVTLLSFITDGLNFALYLQNILLFDLMSILLPYTWVHFSSCYSQLGLVLSIYNVKINCCLLTFTGGVAGDKKCFDQFNSQGVINGHCGLDAHRNYIPCEKEFVPILYWINLISLEYLLESPVSGTWCVECSSVKWAATTPLFLEWITCTPEHWFPFRNVNSSASTPHGLNFSENRTHDLIFCNNDSIRS